MIAPQPSRGPYDAREQQEPVWRPLPSRFEVGDPRTTSPLDAETLIASARKTGRALVVDEGHQSYGVSAELAAVISAGAFHYLDAPVTRLGAMDVPVPFSPVLEDLTVPTAQSVAAAARTLCLPA